MYTKSKLYIIPCNIYTQNSNGHILKNISFSVKKGQVVSIIGPVGSGKVSSYTYFFTPCLCCSLQNSSFEVESVASYFG